MRKTLITSPSAEPRMPQASFGLPLSQCSIISSVAARDMRSSSTTADHLDSPVALFDRANAGRSRNAALAQGIEKTLGLVLVHRDQQTAGRLRVEQYGQNRRVDVGRVDAAARRLYVSFAPTRKD